NKSSSSAALSNDTYQLFIDNESSLVYADKQYINQGGAIEQLGKLTIARIGAAGDFAFSAESGTVWMYESAWRNKSVDITANGDTTIIDSKISRTYSSGAGGYIRLCVFPIGTSTGTPYIQFQVTCNTNSMQTIDLLPYYTVNGIIDLFGKITAPQYVQANYNIYYGVDQLLHTHTGSYSSAVYIAWIHMMTGSGSVTVTVSKQSSYWATRVTEILTQDIVTSISGSQTQIPILYSLGNGGIISNMIQGVQKQLQIQLNLVNGKQQNK
ncbi:MAG: hypothetical protein EZS28_045481, partial [Streblomastix strix]